MRTLFCAFPPTVRRLFVCPKIGGETSEFEFTKMLDHLAVGSWGGGWGVVFTFVEDLLSSEFIFRGRRGGGEGGG